MIRELDIESVHRNPGQPRQHFDQGALEELADSIQERGLISPILVRPNAEGYEIVHGERRWRAHKLAGLPTIRAEIEELADDEAYTTSVIENEQREDLSAIETARALQRMMDAYDLTQAGVAKRISKSRSWVAQKLRLLNLSEPVQSHVRDGALTEGHCRQLLKLRTAEKPEQIEDLADRAVTESWSVSRLTSEVDVTIAGESDPETEEPDAVDFVTLAFVAGVRVALCHVTQDFDLPANQTGAGNVSRDTLEVHRG